MWSRPRALIRGKARFGLEGCNFACQPLEGERADMWATNEPDRCDDSGGISGEIFTIAVRAV